MGTLGDWICETETPTVAKVSNQKRSFVHTKPRDQSVNVCVYLRKLMLSGIEKHPTKPGVQNWRKRKRLGVGEGAGRMENYFYFESFVHIPHHRHAWAHQLWCNGQICWDRRDWQKIHLFAKFTKWPKNRGHRAHNGREQGTNRKKNVKVTNGRGWWRGLLRNQADSGDVHCNRHNEKQTMPNKKN